MKALSSLALTGILLLHAVSLSGQESTRRISVFRDSLDNAIDLGDWLVNKKGVLIVPSLITEPAVGYGIAGGAVFFHSSYSEKSGPPSMSGVLGGVTQNGTYAAGLFHVGYWKQDRIRYMGALARTYINLGFYGSGNTGSLGEEPVNLNMDAWMLVQQLKFRVAESDFFIGGRYLLFDTKNTFDAPIDIPDFTGEEFSSTLSEATIRVDLDSRNNVFTPTRGLFFSLAGTYSDTWMGGDALYGRLGLTLIGYIPAGNRFFIGLRHEGTYSLGDVPFYARPIIMMRGAPLMKYQNRNITLMEAELSYNVYKRWYINGFTGIGNAYENLEDFEQGKSVATLGTGFRYLIARKLGTNMGMDFAVSNDDFAFYIVFGTAWLR
ncbi:MAG: outer membrane protein assembly factor [Bacteroidales bacterium]|jgi:hypothetical protein|nr:outer membrane protein assembly factor [Bacteroidales bacterium]